MEDIANELLITIKFIPKEERSSRWYKEYLEKLHKDLLSEQKKL